MNIEALYKVGDRVRATKTITESGKGPGREDAKRLDPDWIHARAGELGTVEHVDYPLTWPTVRFDRTGTATIVHHSEIEAVS